MKRGDWILTFAVLLAAALLFCLTRTAGGARKATVYVNGAVQEEIDLARVTEAYVLEAGGCRIRVEPERICFLRGHCPDETCAEAGWLSEAGQTAACLPNRTVIVISGAPDGVTGGV